MNDEQYLKLKNAFNEMKDIFDMIEFKLNDKINLQNLDVYADELKNSLYNFTEVLKTVPKNEH